MQYKQLYKEKICNKIYNLDHILWNQTNINFHACDFSLLETRVDFRERVREVDFLLRNNLERVN